jgi:oligopeptide/dipeptide ABC transporter ATP-binding protein
MAVLEINDLEICFRSGGAEARAVDGISLSVEEGECLGLIGESGCGKSTIAKAVMGILPRSAAVTRGQIRFHGRDLLAMSEEELRQLRGGRLALIPQAAMNGFDPVYRLGAQLREVLESHERMSKVEMERRAKELFAVVGLPAERLKDFPHQFSGGMRQRAMIAMALLLDPDLLVADEPTTGLDVLVQDQILESVIDNSVRRGSAMLLITHDMGVVAENCDNLAVMYAGRIVEYGNDSLFRTAAHPYTLGLRNAFPDLSDRGHELVAIPGSPPDIFSRQLGCCFRDRCPFVTAKCGQSPPIVEVSPGHRVACHYTERADEFRKLAAEPATWEVTA